MADKTLGIKVSEEVYEKAQSTITMSGLTAKDWLEKALALYEVNSLKEGIGGDYKNDLSELEVHTKRIYELINNMVARSIYLKDSAVKEVADKLESKESIISSLQEQNKTLKFASEALEEQLKTSNENEIELKDKLTSMQNALDNNQALINEYQQKNDALNGLVAKYSSHAEENERLKAELTTTKADLTERATTAEKDNEQLKSHLKDWEELLAKMQKQHQDEINILIDKKDVERERELVKLERENQEKLTSSNEKIRSLYDEIAQLRNSYENQIKDLKIKLPPLKQNFEKE